MKNKFGCPTSSPNRRNTMRGRTRLTVVVPTASESGARKARLLLRLAAGFPLVAVGACEWLAEPEPEAYRPPAAGADEQPAGEALGEAPHMLALAREIPGFGGYWYEHESAPAPGADGADNRPGGGRLVIALTEAGAGSFPVARRAVLASRRAAEVTRAPFLTSELPEPPPEVVERVVDFTFIELARHRARLRAPLFAIPEVVSLAVDEEINRVVIGLDDMSGKAEVLAVVSELEVPVEVISLSHREAVKENALAGDSPPHASVSEGTRRLDRRIPDGRLRAGFQVEAEGGKKCTLGFTAVADNGALVFVSNSHCSKIPYETDLGGWGQHDLTNLVGNEMYDPPVRRCYKPIGGVIPRWVDCRDDRWGWTQSVFQPGHEHERAGGWG